MVWIKAKELRGTHVILQPLAHHHHDDLVEAVHDGELWKLWYTFVPEPNKIKDMIHLRLTMQQSEKMISYAVIEPMSNKAVGVTSYLNIEQEHKRLEIGGTWYRKNCQGTLMNTECKLMLLTHAFERLDCIAVEFRTHVHNGQSRAAIERLGAKLDGILRNHMIMPNNTLRDTCVYSIIAKEWQGVKTQLLRKLSLHERSE